MHYSFSVYKMPYYYLVKKDKCIERDTLLLLQNTAVATKITQQNQNNKET